MSFPSDLWSYKIILKDHSGDPGADVNGEFDLTTKDTVLELNDGCPISAKITLNAQFGRYITQTPIIKEWDRIYIEITDEFGSIYRTVVHVQHLHPNRTVGGGVQLILDCPHQSSNLMTRTISRPNTRPAVSGYAALNDAIVQLNRSENSGAKDPVVSTDFPFDITKKTGNDLNPALANDYIFESLPFESVVDEILTKEGDVVENGGAFQFHYFRFQSAYLHDGNETLLDIVKLQVYPQGYHNVSGSFVNTPTKTIKKNPLGQAPSIYQTTDTTIDTERATNLIAIGDKKSGTYPKDYSIFQGQKEQFNAAPLYDGTLTYLTDMRVYVISGSSKVFYKAIASVPLATPPPNATYWVLDNTFSPTVDYSPLTKQKAQYWINAGGGWKWAATANSLTSVVDANVIIQDAFHNRTWVDTYVTAGAMTLGDLDSQGVLDNSVVSHRPFDGLRVLVVGTGSGLFSGNDPNGIPFSNNIAEFRENEPGDGSGKWYVYRVTQTDDEVFSYREGESLTFAPSDNASSYTGPNGQTRLIGTTADGSGFRLVGWQSGAYVDFNFPGVGNFGIFNPGGSFDCVHPVKKTGTTLELGNTVIDPADDTGNNSAVYANFGGDVTSVNSKFAGLNFAFPVPRNGNTIPYGGTVKVGEKIALRVFDMLNMFRDHKGNREWFGPDVEDFYPVQGFNFFELIQDTAQLLAGPTFLNLSGNYKMQLWLADRADNQIMIEYIHGHNNLTEPQDCPLGKVKIYRGIPGRDNWLPQNEIEILNIFDFRSAIRGGIQTGDSFNDRGQFSGLLSSKFTITEKLQIAIDAFRMIKPLVATNITSEGSKPDRNIEAQKIDASSVINYSQLSNLVKSMERIYNFKPDMRDVETRGRCDIPHGDPVYYTDDELIPDTTDGLVNTKKYVVDNITYTISKTSDGPGGFKRVLKLITRVFPS